MHKPTNETARLDQVFTLDIRHPAGAICNFCITPGAKRAGFLHVLEHSNPIGLFLFCEGLRRDKEEYGKDDSGNFHSIYIHPVETAKQTLKYHWNQPLATLFIVFPLRVT